MDQPHDKIQEDRILRDYFKGPGQMQYPEGFTVKVMQNIESLRSRQAFRRQVFFWATAILIFISLIVLVLLWIPGLKTLLENDIILIVTDAVGDIVNILGNIFALKQISSTTWIIILSASGLIILESLINRWQTIRKMFLL